MLSNIQLDIWGMLYAFCALHGYILLAVLFVDARRRGATPQPYILMVVACASFIVTYQLIVNTGLHLRYPHLSRSGIPFWYLIPSLVYLHVASAHRTHERFRRRDLIHLLPFVAYVASYLPFYLMSGTEKLTIMNGKALLPLPQWLRNGWLFGYIVMALTYGVAAARRLILDERAFKSQSASSDVRYIRFQRNVVLTFAVYVALDAAATVVWIVTSEFFPVVFNLSFVAVSTFIYSIGYAAIRAPEGLFVDIRRDPIKYEKSAMGPEEASELREALDRLMREDHPYLDSDLKLQHLAATLGVSTQKLSRLLNQDIGLNFYDYVNRYRVELAKDRLVAADAAGLTVLAIAYEVGFKSPSSFYRMFRKQVGVSPADYRKKGRMGTVHKLPHIRKAGSES